METLWNWYLEIMDKPKIQWTAVEEAITIIVPCAIIGAFVLAMVILAWIGDMVKKHKRKRSRSLNEKQCR